MVSVGEFSPDADGAAVTLARPKIQDLHRTIGLDLDIAGFQIAMRDALVVRASRALAI